MKRRFLALLMSAAMAVTLLPAFSVKAEESSDTGNSGTPKQKVMAEYDMSHADGTLTDISGNGNNAKLVGITDSDFAEEDGENVLNFSGDSGKYVEIPAGLIEEENFTIEATFKTEKVSNQWLFCLGNKVSTWPNVKNYVFFCPTQGGNGNSKDGNIRAGLKDGSKEVLLAQDGKITENAYNTVKYEFNEGVVSVYLNDTLIETTDSGYSIQDIISAGTDGTALGYIGKSLYSPDPAYKGTLKSFKLSATEKDHSDEAKVAEAKEALTLPYNTTDQAVYGNITLPTEAGDGVAVTWTTDKPEIVDVQSHENEGYDATPAGTVTRPDKDTDVTMTATLKLGDATATKDFIFTVKKAVKAKTADDYSAYFFTYFAGEGYSDGEQIYFAASKNGLKWQDLNDNKPVLTSTLGEKGVRDPFIIRSAEGDKFYMIATDLKINGGNGWGAAQTAGSQSLMVWESTDLVNWSDERMVEVSASIGAGCTWAPEAAYDYKTGEYVVFWASKVSGDNYAKQRLYYSKTRDFYTFTEPQVYIDMDQSSIDTTIIYNNDDQMYYRYTKNEGGSTNSLGAKTKTVYVERCATLLGKWEHIASDSLNSNQWVEGPTIFQFNSQDTDGNSKWCLLVDNYGGGGYYPLVSDDLSSGVFTKPDSYKMPSRARHGTPIPVTQEEYNALMAKWGTNLVQENTEEEEKDPVLSYDFENTDGTTIKDVSGHNNDGTLNGNAAVKEENGSNVLYLDGTSGTFASLPTGFFDGRNKFTISMDVKPEKVDGNFFTFAVGKDSNKYLFMRQKSGSIKSVITSGSWSAEQGVDQSVDQTLLNEWQNITIVKEAGKMSLYLNGEKIAEKTGMSTDVTDLGKDLKAYLGKSFYSADGYFKGAYDNVKVYNRALSEDEIAGTEEFAIVKNPESVEGVVGETAEFTVEATGKGLTYEWQYCNANSTKWRTSVMEGSDTATVKVPVANWRDGQKYRCVVTNGDGEQLISETAVVTMQKPIKVQPVSVEAAKGTTAEFTVETSWENVTYQWEYCNANSNKWRTSSMEGNDTATIKVPAGSWRNGQKYRCVITGADGRSVTSEAAVLTVISE